MIRWLSEKLGLHRCPECSTLVDFAMDGLEDGQRGRVRKHLSECPPCMEQVRDFIQVNEALGLTVPESECPQGFEQRVLQRLKQEEHAPLRPIPSGVGGGWAQFWLRVGPVFAMLSVVMSLVAFTAVMRSGAPAAAAAGNDLGSLTEALLKDPRSQRVALSGAGAGELVLCKGMKNVYVRADSLRPCAKGSSYVLWMQPKGQAQSQRVAGFLTEKDGQTFQLLQLPQALDGKGPVTFTLTQQPMDKQSQPAGPALLSGSVDL